MHAAVRAGPAYRGNIWRLFAVQALVRFALWVPIWVVFLQRKGLSLTEVGLLEGIAWTITAFLEVPTGAIADRWGRKASIALGASLYGLAMFLILADALSPAFLLGYALWNSSTAFVSGADSALLYDSLKADGRAGEAAKQSGRYAAIDQASQGIASLVGAAIATIDITLCFTVCGVLAVAAAALVLTIHEPPRTTEDGEEYLSYWRNLKTAVRIAARRPVVRALVLLSATVATVPLVVYYVLLQPYAVGVGLPLAALGVVVIAVQLSTVVRRDHRGDGSPRGTPLHSVARLHPRGRARSGASHATALGAAQRPDPQPAARDDPVARCVALRARPRDRDAAPARLRRPIRRTRGDRPVLGDLRRDRRPVDVRMASRGSCPRAGRRCWIARRGMLVRRDDADIERG